MFRSALPLLAALFLLGSLAGSWVGYSGERLFSIGESFFDSGAGYLPAFFTAVWLPGLCLLLSTSFLGYLLVPGFVFLRGFLLSCGLCVLLRYSGFDLFHCLLLFGLPALLTVPAFFLICEDSFLASRVLHVCSISGLYRTCPPLDPRRLLLSALLLTAGTALRLLLVRTLI